MRAYSVSCAKYCTCTSFFFLKKTNIKKFELKFYFLIVVCLFVGYTQVVSWIFWSLSLMVLAGFLVRTYFFILNNKTIFDSGCEQICLKKEIVCIPVQVYCCSIRTNKISVPIANCTLFGVCDLWEWDFKGVFFFRQSGTWRYTLKQLHIEVFRRLLWLQCT